MPYPTATPPCDPTAIPPPVGMHLQGPWLTQSYCGTPTATWYQELGTTSTGTFTIPQVWTNASNIVGTGYQIWTTANTMSITIPAWGTTGPWDYQPTPTYNRQEEQLPTERGHHMNPIEMGRWLRRREEADQIRHQVMEETARLREEQTAERVAQAEAEAAQRRRERAEADARAEALLRTFLTKEQVAQYERDQAFIVQAPSGRRYRLRRKLAGNVDELGEAGNTLDCMCIHPYAECPLADVLICQILMLKNNEAEFRATANHRRVA